MAKWAHAVKKSLKEWNDLAYNVHSASREYFSYSEITMIPVRNLLRWVDFLTPKLKEIAKRQETDKIKNALMSPGQRRQAVLSQMNKER